MMTTFLTIFSGLILFIASQYFLKLIIEPTIELKKCISDFEYNRLYYNNKWLFIDEMKKASKSYVNIACRIQSCYVNIPYYNIISKIFGLPTRSDIISVVKDLITLSNTIVSLDEYAIFRSEERIKKIRIKLNISYILE